MAEDDKERRLRKSQLKSSQGASLKDLPNIEHLQREASSNQMSTPDRSPPKRTASPSLPDRNDHPASPAMLHRDRDDTRSPSPSVPHHHHHKDKGEKKDKDHHHHRGKSPGLDGADMSRSASVLPAVSGVPNLGVTKSTGVLPDMPRPKTPPGEVKPHVSRPPPTDEDEHGHQHLAPPHSPTAAKVNTLKHSMDSRMTVHREREFGPEDFKKVKLLGKGDVGKVYLVQNKETNVYYAMKVLSKQEMIQRNKVKRVMTEREILATTNHPFIVTLYHSFMSMENLYFVMEYCCGGEFFRTLGKQPGRCLPEESAKFYGAEVLLALEYLHSMGFIYRDLKPENILLHETGHIMLTDFDLSKSAASTIQPKMVQKMVVSSGKGKPPQLVNKPDIITNSFVGTEEYIAPEVIEGFGHTSTVDWWTFGILLYEMLFGVTPFRGRNRDDTFAQIMHGGIKFPEKPEVSKDAKSLLKALLTPDPKKRLGAAHGAPDVKAHKWWKNLTWALIRNMPPPIKPKVTGPLDTSNFRKIEDPSMLEEDHALSSQQIDAITHDPNNPFHDFKPLTKPHGQPSPIVPHGGPGGFGAQPSFLSQSMGAPAPNSSPRKSAPGTGAAAVPPHVNSLSRSVAGTSTTNLTQVSVPATSSPAPSHRDEHKEVPPPIGRSLSVHSGETITHGSGSALKSDDDAKKAITSGSDSAAENRREKKEKHHHHHRESSSDEEPVVGGVHKGEAKQKKEKHHHHHIRRDILSGSEAHTSDTDDNERRHTHRHDKKERKASLAPAKTTDLRREVTSGSEAVDESEGDAGKRERKEERRIRKASLAQHLPASSGDEAKERERRDRIDTHMNTATPPLAPTATDSHAPALRKVPSISAEGEGAMLEVKKEKTDEETGAHSDRRHKEKHEKRGTTFAYPFPVRRNLPLRLGKKKGESSSSD